MDAANAFIERHQLTIDLTVVWIVILSCFVIAVGLFTAWWTLRGTYDQTAVGRALKRQKASLTVAFFSNGVYWSAVLAAHYTGHRMIPLLGIALRLLFAGGMVAAAVFVGLFVRALRREIGRERTGIAPLVESPSD